MRPDLTNMNLALSRIDEIIQQHAPQMRERVPASERFVDVLDAAAKKAGKTPAELSLDGLRGLAGRYAEDYNIDEELIRAVIQVESGWNPKAVSAKGARGLMQLMPRTADMLGVDDPFDPEQNIGGGVKYLSDLTDKYNGDIEKALAAYNAGPARIDSGRVPAESERYVRNVMALYRRYREEE